MVPFTTISYQKMSQQKRTSNGKMERIIKAKEILVHSWRAGCDSIGRMVDGMVGFTGRGCLVGLQAISWSTASVLLISCTTIKKAGITSLATGAGATVATALSSGATAPILGGMTGAFVGDVATEVMISEPSKGVVLQTEQGMIECAPDNLWSLLGQVTEIGGWFLILIFVVPMLLGWILPGPLERKKKQKNLFS